MAHVSLGHALTVELGARGFIIMPCKSEWVAGPPDRRGRSAMMMDDKPARPPARRLRPGVAPLGARKCQVVRIIGLWQ
jgi:hypothetical protein